MQLQRLCLSERLAQGVAGVGTHWGTSSGKHAFFAPAGGHRALVDHDRHLSPAMYAAYSSFASSGTNSTVVSANGHAVCVGHEAEPCLVRYRSADPRKLVPVVGPGVATRADVQVSAELIPFD